MARSQGEEAGWLLPSLSPSEPSSLSSFPLPSLLSLFSFSLHSMLNFLPWEGGVVLESSWGAVTPCFIFSCYLGGAMPVCD